MRAVSIRLSAFFAVVGLFSGNHALSDTPEIDIGGAVRLNYAWKDYGADDNGSFDFELFRLDVDVKQGDLFVDAQYRWYQGFDAVHHAAIGFHVTADDTLVAGVTQVPFGIEPYASHSFWFSGAYYLGLEDDYDTGVKWRHRQGAWTWDAAWFISSEYDNAARFDRYSFDVAATDASPYKEDGQLNLRAQYDAGAYVAGASLQWGRIDSESSGSGDHYAVALHLNANLDQWNFQGQWAAYEYDRDALVGQDENRIALSAFEYPFEIAAKAQVLNVNVARSFELNNRFIKKVTCYNDHSYIAASNRAGLDDSVQNVTGCMLENGGLYTYIDWIAGKNMWFAGGPGVGVDNGDSAWQSRLNINIGYYF